jgi:hypothetical protein
MGCLTLSERMGKSKMFKKCVHVTSFQVESISTFIEDNASAKYW